MSVRRRVTVERQTLRFAAAHFTTFEGQCEPLHGHNYDVIVEVEGDLTEDSWVIDFTKLKNLAKALCQELDHKFILQRDSKVLEIDEEEAKWKVCFGERDWVFPKSDVVALPIDNTTAERLAEWFAGRLKQALRAQGATNIAAITVGIEEAPGQTGWYQEDAQDRLT
ncbi:MAG: 6-pyruvoyl tetrahydropterin synthase family protein [Dehalococcoidia bacterium]